VYLILFIVHVHFFGGIPKDDGESESQPVMDWIGVQTLPHAKASRLPSSVSSREKMANRSKWESKWRQRLRWQFNSSTLKSRQHMYFG
jgi:hypothetical protein